MLHVILQVCLMLAVTETGGAQVNWETHYGKAIESAREHSKPLVVVMENPAQPQQRLDENSLLQAAQAGEKLQGYELCRVDVSTDYGQKVAAAFGAKTFPYTAVSDQKSKYLTFRKAGQMSADEWNSALASAHRTARTTVQSTGSSPIVTSPTFSMPSSTPAYCPSCQLRGR
ncbi:MAG: hypothetical protein U0795_26635 [Pirellulales bacterium]